MRSVFVHLSDCSEADVARYLDAAFPAQAGPPWIQLIGSNPCLWIDFYRDHEREPAQLVQLVEYFHGHLPVTVCADITGRIPGLEEVGYFVATMLGRWRGVAQDDNSGRFWSCDEVLRREPCDGMIFFVGPAAQGTE